MKTKFIILCMALVASFAALSAPDFAVTAKSGNYIFDYAPEAESDITGLQFDIVLPKNIGKQSLDISNCTAGVPSTHTGACKVSNGILRVLVYSTSNAILPATSIGSIRARTATAGKRNQLSRFNAAQASGNLKVSNLLYATLDARDVAGDVIQ